MGVPALLLLSERAVRTLYRWMCDVARASPARLLPPALVVLATWWWMSIDVGWERQEQGAGRQRPARLLPTVYSSEPSLRSSPCLNLVLLCNHPLQP